MSADIKNLARYAVAVGAAGAVWFFLSFAKEISAPLAIALGSSILAGSLWLFLRPK